MLFLNHSNLLNQSANNKGNEPNKTRSDARQKITIKKLSASISSLTHRLVKFSTHAKQEPKNILSQIVLRILYS